MEYWNEVDTDKSGTVRLIKLIFPHTAAAAAAVVAAAAAAAAASAYVLLLLCVVAVIYPHRSQRLRFRRRPRRASEVWTAETRPPRAVDAVDAALTLP